MTTPRTPCATEKDGEDLAEAATAWFVRMSSDGVTPEDRRAFRAWFDQDQAHRDAYAEAEALWLELERIPDPRPAAAPKARAAAPAPRRPKRRWSLALAAGILLAVALGLWNLGAYDRLRADHATSVGEAREITLADGSRVHLNTDTALAVDMANDRRHIEIYRGEAFFTVARDPARPFEVAAGDGLARALGTAFAVRRDGAAVTVAVTEGRVEALSGRNTEASGKLVLLGAGDALRLGPGAQTTRLGLGAEAFTAWRQGKLVFADRPLRAVVEELDRYRPGAIIFLDAALAEKRFSGVVSLSDTDRALAAISATLPVEVVQISSYLTVLRSRD